MPFPSGPLYRLQSFSSSPLPWLSSRVAYLSFLISHLFTLPFVPILSSSLCPFSTHPHPGGFFELEYLPKVLTVVPCEPLEFPLYCVQHVLLSSWRIPWTCLLLYTSYNDRGNINEKRKTGEGLRGCGWHRQKKLSCRPIVGLTIIRVQWAWPPLIHTEMWTHTETLGYKHKRNNTETRKF